MARRWFISSVRGRLWVFSPVRPSMQANGSCRGAWGCIIYAGAHIVTRAKKGPWAPGYYYVLFEDPDGIRLEVNFVPGQGVLAKDEGFNPGGDYR